MALGKTGNKSKPHGTGKTSTASCGLQRGQHTAGARSDAPTFAYGLLANGHRADNVALARRLLAAQDHDPRPGDGKTVDEQKTTEPSCPACGGRMIIIEIFEPGAEPTAHHQRAPPEHRIPPS